MSEYIPISLSDLSEVGQRCPRCHQPRMILSKIESGPDDSDYRIFECQMCGRIHTVIVSADPIELNTSALLDDDIAPTR